MLAITNHTFPTEAETTLARFGHRTLRLPPYPCLPEPVASHPDMLLFFAPNAIFCAKSYYEIAKNELEEIASVYGTPIRFIEEEYGKEYPHDVLLNALPLGRHLFCNTKAVSKELLALDFTTCHVNQGYTKCSALPLGNRALITSDASIAESAQKCGIDVLQICKGHISLKGYDYGFIGGSMGRVGDEILFNGDVSLHPDYEKIKEFIEKRGLKLRDFGGKLRDIGSIIEEKTC